MVTHVISRNVGAPPEGRLFVDGANIDGALGKILGHKPENGQRPNWACVREDLIRRYGRLDAEFVLNGSECREKCFPFCRFLRCASFKVRTPSVASHHIDPKGDPVDDYIHSQMRAVLAEKHAWSRLVVLASHDGGYFPTVVQCLRAGVRVVIVGFREWLAPGLLDVVAQGAGFLDIEYDLGAFHGRLDRPWQEVN